MEKIKRFFECLIPESNCNLKCSYCYLIQTNRRTEKRVKFDYSPEDIGRALTKSRLGGTCYFSICAIGETLIPNEIIEIIYILLKNGHYINITTNGTLSKRFDQIISFPKEFKERLNISFSFHYLELKKLNLLKSFFDNINKIKKEEISFLLQFNLCDEYLEHLDEIKKLCSENIGLLPQVALTRDVRTKNIKIESEKDFEEYCKIGNEFNSNLFEFTCENFMKKRKEFCYAGDWSNILNLGTGELKKCYAFFESQNIFENPSKKIKFEGIGNSCQDPYCINSSHFLSLGVIPNLKTSTYYKLRSRENEKNYSQKMRSFLNSKLNESNYEYNIFRKKYINIKNKKLDLKIKRYLYQLLK
ncbi:radical SAM protein [Cetobacterium somerae]|uniref:radical SAM protein n=1 Tax=Cetobacterium somerae TaxID=188913 RepID=UPI00211EF20F|nr:radical SAM protein [Cetobacterium somerae]MCQ9628393.1 radical SAM protein [Cetobacterium somerae]